MGLFRRSRDAQGLYRGDAPVSSPGVDGAAPAAYTRPNPAPGLAPDFIPDCAPDTGLSDRPPGADRAGPIPQQHAAPAPQPYSGPAPGQTRQQRIDNFFTPQPGQSGGRVADGNVLDPATAARVQKALAGMSKRGTKLGCLLIAIPVVGAMVGVGFGIYAATSSVIDAKDAVSRVIDGPAAVPDGRHLGVASLGEPISIRTPDASYDITVFGAEQQIGDGWGYDSPGGRANLVVEAQISRTDTGTEPIEFTGWNWSVVDASGNRATGSIISHFEPSLDGPELVGGQSARGYVAFDTAMTRGSLTVAAGPSSPGLAAWQISTTSPEQVVGEIGVPARAQISRPGFTVTIGAAEVVPEDDARIGHRPTSGQYLALPVTFTGIPGVVGHIGNVDSEQFVFKPDSAPAVFPEFSGVDGAFSFVSIDAAAPETGYLAFDTAAVSGELQWRNQADVAIITWRIDVA